MCLHSLSFTQPHKHTLFHPPAQKETYFALATSSVSVKRKRCLSWVCRPVFSCVWIWPKNNLRGHSARKAWTRGQDSGLTGVKQFSLGRDKRKKYTIRHKGTCGLNAFKSVSLKTVWMWLVEFKFKSGTFYFYWANITSPKVPFNWGFTVYSFMHGGRET